MDLRADFALSSRLDLSADQQAAARGRVFVLDFQFPRLLSPRGGPQRYLDPESLDGLPLQLRAVGKRRPRERRTPDQ